MSASASLAFAMSNLQNLATGLQISSLGIGKSNTGYPLDVAGDINFTGTLRSNGQAYVGSQWTTSNAGTLTYGSNVYIGGSLTVAGSNILQNVLVQNTIIESSNIVINNAGSGPALQVTQSQVTPQPLAQFMAGSNIALYLASNAFVGIGKSNPAYTLDILGNINVSGSVLVNGAALSNSGGSGGSSGTGAICQSIWYSNSNVSASNYVGLTATAGTIVQNNSTNGTSPFSVSTGLFTCQYAGTYQCNFTGTTIVPQAAVTIYRNGAAIAPGYVTYGNVNNSISLSASVNCSATDTLGFYVTSGTIQGAVGGAGTQGCSISLLTSGTAATGMGVPNQVVFTSGTSQTWTVPTGVTAVQVEMVGGGGGGGAVAGNGTYSGGGGGAGAYIRSIIPVSGGSNVTYTVGTGGAGVLGTSTTGGAGGNGVNTTVTYASTTFTANGGTGGNNNGNASGVSQGGRGGTYSVSGSGYSSYYGANGGDGGSAFTQGPNVNPAMGGNGGASYYGSGGFGANGASVASTNVGVYGAGGGGGAGTYQAGGAGAPGVVIITYFTQSGLPTNYTATAPLSMSGTTLSIAAATSSSAGVVQPDNISTVVSSGVLAAAAPFRNRIINGNMAIDQRNSATTAITTQQNYAMDRFQLNVALTSGSVSLGQAATPATLSGFTKCAKLIGSSINVSGVNTFVGIVQIIEGQNMADLMWGTSSAQPITLSFWVYSTATGTYSAGVRNSVPNRAYQSTYTIAAANTWQQVSVTIPGDTTGTWPTDNSGSLQLWLTFASSSNLATTAGSWQTGNYIAATGMSNLGSNTAYVTGVQLEKGSIATPFEYRPPSVELQLCQRYYWRMTPFPGTTGSFRFGIVSCRGSTIAHLTQCLPVAMRAQPSAVGGSGTFLLLGSAGSVTITSIGGVPTDSSSFAACWDLNMTSTLSYGQAAELYTSSTSAYLDVSCEL